MKKSMASLAGAGVLAVLASTNALGATIYATPAEQSVSLIDGTAVFELFMDFTDEATLGGSIDLDFSGPISFNSFVPSAWFNTVPEAVYTGFETERADGDLMIRFGRNPPGLSGVNSLGTVTVNLLGEGAGILDININSIFGPFVSASTFDVMEVELHGAQLDIVSPVPLPAAAWLLLSGLGALGVVRRRAA